MVNKPVVSIIIPVYNRRELLYRAIKSVINQTYRNIEIIVIDDGSNEDIKSVCESFNDLRIRYFRHIENKGAAAARNTGLKNCRGDFVAFLDSDDEYLPQKIEKQIEVFVRSKDIDVVYCSLLLEEENGKYHLIKTASNKWFVLLQQIMFKREVIEKVGFLDETFITIDDFDYVYRLRKSCRFASINEPLVIHHYTPFSLEKNLEIRNKDWEKFIKKYHDIMVRKDISETLYQAGKSYLRENKITESMKSFLLAYISYPLNQRALRKIIRTSPLLFFYILKRRKKQ